MIRRRKVPRSTLPFRGLATIDHFTRRDRCVTEDFHIVVRRVVHVDPSAPIRNVKDQQYVRGMHAKANQIEPPVRVCVQF